MSVEIDGNRMTFTAGEALGANELVYLSAAYTVSKSGVANTPVGVNEAVVESGGKATVRLFNRGGVAQLKAASAATVNAAAYTAASGKVNDATPTGASLVGWYLEAPSGDGSIVPVLLAN